MMKMEKLNNEVMKMLKSAVVVLSSKYNFDGEEGYRMICECEGLSSSSGVKRSSKKVSTKEKIVKSAFALPYNGELHSECCFGLRLNSGLYTQCPSLRPEDGAYCASCNKQATKNEHGLPDYGSIQTRSSKYLKDEEFVDPSGKKPVSYTKIMKKLKLTEEQVREEAAKHNMTLDPRHFVEAEKKSGRPAKVVTEKEPKELKAKGRPKKSKKVLELAGEEEDLFASLVMSSLVPSASKTIEEDVIEETVTSEVSENESEDNSSLGDVDVVVEAKPKPSKPKAEKMSHEEKAALALAQQNQKKLALAEQKAAEKLALAEQKAAEKLALAEQKKAEAEQKKLALAEQKAAEKLALAEQKKAEAEQKKLALAELKKQEAELKKKAVTEKKAPEKKVLAKQKKTKVDDDDRPSPAFVDPPEEADVVKKIMFEGKKYLKSKNTGIIYNMEQDVIGKWNEEKNRIDFDETGEESEEEYDEDV
jgi:hypothetical protein